MQDLSDVSTLMQLLNRLRDEESEIEQRRLKPFVQTYGLLATYDVRVTKEEQDSVDALSVKWGELVALARQTMQHLRRIGPTFRVTLLQNMKDFVAATVVFKEDYDRGGRWCGASNRASPWSDSRRSRSNTASSSGRRRSTRWGRTCSASPRPPDRSCRPSTASSAC